MEQTPQLILFEVLTGVFAVLWLWQAAMYVRVLRNNFKLTDSLHMAGLTLEEYKLAAAMLKQNQITQATTKELVDCLKIMNGRTEAYNARLNLLTEAVRTKVSRIDKQGITM